MSDRWSLAHFLKLFKRHSDDSVIGEEELTVMVFNASTATHVHRIAGGKRQKVKQSFSVRLRRKQPPRGAHGWLHEAGVQ